MTYRTHTFNIYIDIIYDTKMISKKMIYIHISKRITPFELAGISYWQKFK